MLRERWNIQSIPPAVPEARTPTLDYEERKTHTRLDITVDAHSRAKGNLSRVTELEKYSDISFPSRPSMARFVRAYFTHMAPYVPIVHGPTFDVCSLHPLLLLEIMACGAVYSNEMQVAKTMHRSVLNLLLESTLASICRNKGTEFELWRLQTTLLATYFEVLDGTPHWQDRSRFTLLNAVKLVESALKKPAASTVDSWATWICQETLSRCISCSIILASDYFSTSAKRAMNVPYLDSEYPLPCTTSQWSSSEADENTAKPVLSNSEVMEGIMQGKMPLSEFSEYAFLAVVCNVRCRVCSFEALSISCHPSLKSTFIETMDAAMSALRQATSRMNYEHSSPLHRHTSAALNSAFLHLYSSYELSGMKRLLRNPEMLRDSQEMSSLFDSPFSPLLKRSLICAAKALQLDFETGVNYLRITAPLRFDPLEIHALCESGLLLFWYLMSKKINPKTFEWHQDVSDTVEEVLSEVKDLAVGGQIAILPLAACATMFHLLFLEI
ncbi:hypothetical protein IQ07DRAFT_120068 [Pyrenochaeta sp. DS3sAY3a]|nr:hypothetical protein IQ07DRAFT_120068 [Pyrenochaeta sp. DS3sAY3a]